jgi:aryl-alcohol dehydrogenase-like predicted oxidoreductase
MEYTQIPGISEKASVIGLGTWAISGWKWGGTEEDESIRTIHSAQDKGINLIDTAPIYGFGHSEEIVGKALRGERREKFIVATKAGIDWSDGSGFRNSSAARLRQELEDSLRRLQTDVIDIYQIHWPDGAVPMEDTGRLLESFRQEGKIRAIGVSNFSISQMEKFKSAAPISTIQPPYNLYERDIEKEILPYAKQHGVTVLAYGALCRGLLSGKMKADSQFDADHIRKADPKFNSHRYEQYLAATAELDHLAKSRFGKSVLNLAVRWLLQQGSVIALWGARVPDQLDAVSSVEGWSIDAQSMADIETILTKNIKDPVGPVFMAPALT